MKAVWSPAGGYPVVTLVWRGAGGCHREVKSSGGCSCPVATPGIASTLLLLESPCVTSTTEGHPDQPHRWKGPTSVEVEVQQLLCKRPDKSYPPGGKLPYCLDHQDLDRGKRAQQDICLKACNNRLLAVSTEAKLLMLGQDEIALHKG